MSALAALKRDAVARLENEIVATEKRVERFAARVAELESADEVDAAKIAQTEKEIESAKSERAILDRALTAARKAAAVEAKARIAREKEELEQRLLRHAEALKPKILSAMETLARLLGENASVTAKLSGPLSMRFWYSEYAEQASAAACRGVKPKTAPIGSGQIVVTDLMQRSFELTLIGPATDVE